MPWNNPSSHPTSCACATRSSASLGTESSENGRLRRPASSRASGARPLDSSLIDDSWISRSRARLASSSGAARTSSSSCLIMVPIRITFAGCSTMSASDASSAVGLPASPPVSSVAEPSGPSVTMRKPSGRGSGVSMPSVMTPSSPRNPVRTTPGSAKVGRMTNDPVTQTAERSVSRPRLVSPEDAPELLRLIEICDTAAIGAPDYSLEDVEDDVRRPTWTGWVVEGDDGFVAYGWTDRQSGQPWVNAEVRVRPEHPAEIGDELLDVVRRHAATVDASLPVRLFTVAGATAARTRLDAAGGTVVRHYWRMVLDLPDAEPAEPALPDQVTVEQP